MSPYAFTLLLDQAGILGFAFFAGVAGAYRLVKSRWTEAMVLFVAASMIAMGVLPVLGKLLAGHWLAASLPGLTLAQTVPWVTLCVLTLLRSAPGPVHHQVDEIWLAGLGLAVQGVPGLALGLALMMQRWLAPGRARGLPLAAVGLLVGAVFVGSYPDALRDTLGGLLGLSRDAQVWTVHLLVSTAEALGWSALGAHVLGWTGRREAGSTPDPRAG
ncbi:MAG: hypothetical protein AAF211_03155 [Myxococcota bacterium]